MRSWPEGGNEKKGGLGAKHIITQQRLQHLDAARYLQPPFYSAHFDFSAGTEVKMCIQAEFITTVADQEV